ncbi:hypothetical protein U1Q18_050665, partial [Sarracenia purpurea var. burkii]
KFYLVILQTALSQKALRQSSATRAKLIESVVKFIVYELQRHLVGEIIHRFVVHQIHVHYHVFAHVLLDEADIFENLLILENLVSRRIRVMLR